MLSMTVRFVFTFYRVWGMPFETPGNTLTLPIGEGACFGAVADVQVVLKRLEMDVGHLDCKPLN
jgi:hypothetical protein